MSDNITLIGTVGSEPKYTTSQNGTDRIGFRFATTHRKYDKNENKWVDASTNWFNVVAFKQLASNAAASITKGQRLVVQGRLEIREYDKEDGSKGTSVEILAETIAVDLTWGTATYTKTTGGSTASATPAGDPWAATPTAWGTESAI
jgi:single-strand DNA-binding protein